MRGCLNNDTAYVASRRALGKNRTRSRYKTIAVNVCRKILTTPCVSFSFVQSQDTRENRETENKNGTYGWFLVSRPFTNIGYSWSFSREKSKRGGREPEGSAGNMVCPFCSAMCTERVVFTNRRTCAFLAWMDFLGLVYGYLFKAFQVLTRRSTKWKLESSRFWTTYQQRSIVYENTNKIERNSFALRTKAYYVGIKEKTDVPRHRIS